MRVLITGGAGFIGSSLAVRALAEGHAVRILDDLSTGFRANVPEGVELLEGDVADEPLVRRAVEGVDVVFHEAAHRAVARSVETPLATDRANTHGTLTLLTASKDAEVRRFVYASSSSVYGGVAPRPTSESAPVLPRSPYAVTKLAGEHYCRVFAELFGLETVALRYFNVFGPRQRPDSMYAAVIPLFLDALRAGRPVTVHGDGEQSRDFTFIDDVVDANFAAALAPAERCSGQVFNIAGGAEYSLLTLIKELSDILGVEPVTEHVAPRAGDVRHSCADPQAAADALGFRTRVPFREGLERTVDWFAGRG